MAAEHDRDAGSAAGGDRRSLPVALRYPNGVLRNLLGVTDQQELNRREADYTLLRLEKLHSGERGPAGPFDFGRLKATHAFIFERVYEWAGQVRTTALGKAEHDQPGSPVSQFAAPADIERQAAALFGRLAGDNFLRDRGRASFCRDVVPYFAGVNDLHPFLDVNKRRSVTPR